MRKSLSRLGHFVILIILFFCLLFVYSCINYQYIKAFEGSDLPANQIAKLYLDKGFWFRAYRDRPISFVLDGKPYEEVELTPCLLILPGEHELRILPKPQKFVDPLSKPIDKDGTYYDAIRYTAVPTPELHILNFIAEKGREYLLAEKYPDSLKLDYMIFWIEDKGSNNKITEEVRFEWK